MKKYISILLLTLAGATSAWSATVFEVRDGVTVFANSVSTASGNYYNQTFTSLSSPYISSSELESSVTDMNPATFVWSPDYHLSASGGATTFVDMAFNAPIYNGDGFDLVLFFAGNGTNFKDGSFAPFQFGIDINADGTQEGGLFGVTNSSTTYNGGAFVASYAQIDLDDFGFDKQTPLGDIRIMLGDRSMPALSMVGAYHISPTASAVPLPLPIVLFSSGLALFGFVARKNRN